MPKISCWDGVTKHNREERQVSSFSYGGGHQKFEEHAALVALLKVCAIQKNLFKGSRIHADILKRGLLEKHISIGNTLVNFYAKCGAFAKAHQLFDELSVRDVVSWNALITGYAQLGHGEGALNCFERMQDEGLFPNEVTFLCILKACGSIGAAAEGHEIHVELIRRGLMGDDSVLGTALVDMYAKCGALAKAQELFDELQVQNVVSWTALIAGYAQHGYAETALKCFEQMQDNGFSPNALTYACILKACGSIRAAEKGAEIHDEITAKGLLRGNSVLGTSLVDMYAKCGALAKAQEVFDELLIRDIVSWNALIAGYCQYGPGEEAFNCFERLKADNLSPDAVTFACILRACGNKGAVEKGQEVHNEVVKKGLLRKNRVLGTALVDMYAKCGAVMKAQEVFDELPVRDVASWNALMSAYCQHGRGEQALDCFELMRCRDGVSPDAVSFACVLKACGSMGAAEKGREVHAEIVKEGFMGKASVLGSALIDMYARCGAFAKAQEVFDKLPVRDVVSWTALITGYAHVGKHDIAFSSFSKMIGEGIEPNLVTFFVVLNACSYLGFVDEGQTYFETMSTRYGMIPPLEHCTCMVDLFSRVGHFEKAMRVLEKMPSSDHLPAWLALLGACRKWGNMKLGRLAFDHALRLDKRSAVAYVCMRDIYAAAGMHKDANKIEHLRIENVAWKKRGQCLWINDNEDVQSLGVGETGFLRSSNIKLEDVAFKL